MWRKTLLTLALALTSGALHAQFSNTIEQPLGTNISAIGHLPAACTTTAGCLKNIGQSQHQVVFIWGNAPAHTCTSPAPNAGFVASTDGTTFFSLTTFAATSASPLHTTFTATGAYPFLWFNIASFDTTNCIITEAHYTGVLFPAPNVPTMIGVFDTTGGVSFVNACTEAIGFSVAAAATTEIIPLSSGKTIRVCGLTLAMSAAGTFQLVTGTGVNCGTGTAVLMPAGIPLATGVPWTFGGNLGTAFPVPTSGALCGAAVTGNVVGVISYTRY